jgi:hypothetical protein
MTSIWQRVKDFWTMPRFGAVLLVVMAVFAFAFIAHKPSQAPIYGPAQDKASVLTVASNVTEQEVSSINDLPVPVARTAAGMRTAYRSDGWHVHVYLHGAHIMVTFPKEPAVCVWVPLIVNGPKNPAIVSC